MKREKIVEVMAKARCSISDAHWPSEPRGHRRAWMKREEPILTALEAAGYAVVPKEPTEAMQEAIWLASQLQNANAQYRAMIAAAEVGDE